MLKGRVSKYLMRRRFRMKLRSLAKKKLARKKLAKELQLYKDLRQIGKKVKTLSEAINLFMPNHFKYLVTTGHSPLNEKKLKIEPFKRIKFLNVPKEFSILNNPTESYDFLKKIVSQILNQSCKELWLDYSNCISCDLSTQVFMDSILIDNDKFIHNCQRAGLSRYLRICSVGGRNINNTALQQMINSVGSPVELLNKSIAFKNIIPFKLRHIDGLNTTEQRKKGQKEIDTTALIQYVIDSLSVFNKTLNQTARQNLGNVVGEIISNAEEHSSLHNRYLIGFMEENLDTQIPHFGILNLVMMNSGRTIYEKFKYPESGEPINYNCIEKMKELSQKFKKRNFFSLNRFSEENLWTLYSLQGGVSCIPPEIRKRGNGTIEFIESFFKLKGSLKSDNISMMSIISGNTRIDFDGTYCISKAKTIDGESIGKMTFNNTNSLEDKPDSKYVYHINHYFPGTIICAKILINETDIK